MSSRGRTNLFGSSLGERWRELVFFQLFTEHLCRAILGWWNRPQTLMPLVKMASRFEDNFIVLVSKLVSVKKKKNVVDFLQIQLWFSCFFSRLTFFSEDAVYSQQCRSHTGLTALLSPPSPSPLLFLTSPACVCVHKVSHWMMCVVSARGISSSNIDHW